MPQSLDQYFIILSPAHDLARSEGRANLEQERIDQFYRPIILQFLSGDHAYTSFLHSITDCGTTQTDSNEPLRLLSPPDTNSDQRVKFCYQGNTPLLVREIIANRFLAFFCDPTTHVIPHTWKQEKYYRTITELSAAIETELDYQDIDLKKLSNDFFIRVSTRPELKQPPGFRPLSHQLLVTLSQHQALLRQLAIEPLSQGRDIDIDRYFSESYTRKQGVIVTAQIVAGYFSHCMDVKKILHMIDQIELTDHESIDYRDVTASMLLGFIDDAQYVQHRDALFLWSIMRARRIISPLLLDNGANVNYQDADGTTALMVAASYGDMGLVEWLLQARADVNAKDKKGKTALHYARGNSQQDVARFLHSLNADDPGKKKQSFSMLVSAAERGDVATVKYLLEKNTSVHGKSGSRHTPLYCAIYHGHADIVRLLVEQGADTNEFYKPKTSSGFTPDLATSPLWLCLSNNRMELAAYLLQHQARVDEPEDELGFTAIIRAAEGGNIKLVKLLLTHGADVNAKTRHGDTALMRAAARGYYDAVELLLDNHVDIHAKNNDGLTALQLAKDNHNDEIVSLLQSRIG